MLFLIAAVTESKHQGGGDFDSLWLRRDIGATATTDDKEARWEFNHDKESVQDLIFRFLNPIQRFLFFHVS